MFFKKLHLLNYACHADTTLECLTPVTVLVGPNGGGKSVLFEAIRTFSRILTGPVGQAFGPPPFSFEDKVFRGASQREMAFEAELVEAQFPAVPIQYSIRLGYTGAENVGSPPSILDEKVRLGDQLVFDRSSRSLDVKGLVWNDIVADASLLAMIRNLPKNKFKGPKALGSLASEIGSVVNYRLEPRQLSRASQEPDLSSVVRMGYEGENLPACLYWLSENEPNTLKKIIKDLQRVIPQLHGITFNTVRVDRIGFSLEFDDARHRVLAPNVSSGTLMALGLVTLLNSPTQPHIACIEEPETGLTPDAVRLFFELLCDVAKQKGAKRTSQFLFSSHSPFVLVDAWNSLTSDRAYIKRLHLSNGHTVIDDVQSIIERGDSGAVLQHG
ncbi:MAG: AAA family ATPase, partial [Planctomycetes bacterium]|nr:AAA family ATPase [Planctomycetota bacterium]